MIDLVLVALFQVAAGEPAIAETPPQAAAQSEQQTAENEAPPAERRRCRREQIVGTRMTQRVCTTADEDRQAEREARDFTQRMQSQNPLQGN